MKGIGGKGEGLAKQEERQPVVAAFEVNLEDAPIFACQDRELDEFGVYEWVERYASREGTEGQRVWRFNFSKRLGVLRTFDQDVYVAISALMQERGGMPADGRVPFTLYEVVKVLGMANNGQNYQKVRESIVRFQETKIVAENAFYSKEKLGYTSEHFSIINRVKFEANTELYGRATERHVLKFDEVLVNSYRAGHIKPLDVNFYLALDKAYSKGLYSKIDQKRGEGLVWSENVKKLKELIGMAPSYKKPYKIKEKLQPAHEELKRKGFLESVRYDVAKQTLHYRVSSEFLRYRTQFERSWTQEENEAIRALIRNGVWPNVAKDLVSKKGAEVCAYYVRALPYQKNVRSNGAWLKKYITEEHPPPVGPPLELFNEKETAAGAEVSKGTDRSPADERKSGYDWLFEGARSKPVEGQSVNEDTQTPTKSVREGSAGIDLQVDPYAQDLFREMLETLADRLNTPSLRVWFEGTEPRSLSDEGLLTITVPNRYAREYIEERFKPALEEALRARLSRGDAALEIFARS